MNANFSFCRYRYSSSTSKWESLVSHLLLLHIMVNFWCVTNNHKPVAYNNKHLFLPWVFAGQLGQLLQAGDYYVGRGISVSRILSWVPAGGTLLPIFFVMTDTQKDKPWHKHSCSLSSRDIHQHSSSQGKSYVQVQSGGRSEYLLNKKLMYHTKIISKSSKNLYMSH